MERNATNTVTNQALISWFFDISPGLLIENISQYFLVYFVSSYTLTITVNHLPVLPERRSGAAKGDFSDLPERRSGSMFFTPIHWFARLFLIFLVSIASNKMAIVVQ